MNSTVCGVAVNDIGETRVAGVPCPRYKMWLNMINRCYGGRRREYANCKVVEKWLTFSTFREWQDGQDWVGKELDKDILGNGQLYSPDTCCFVPKWLNLLFITSPKSPYPRGATFDPKRQKFRAMINIYGRSKNLGRFKTLEKALAVYNAARLEYVTERLTNYSDQRVKLAAIEKCT